jgi:hypothetical protein
MTLALPNSIYMNMDFQASAYEIWKYLEALHRKEELHHIRMKHILESCLSMIPLKTILPAPPSPAVDHGSLIYTPNGLFFNPPNAPEPIFIPQYHPATLYNHMQSLLQNLVKLGKASTDKGKCMMTSTYESFNTMEDTDDEEDLIEQSMAFLAYTENIVDLEDQDYDSTPFFDDNVEYNATLSQMEVEGGNLNAVLQSVKGDIPSDDEYADLESNTADLEADTADVMLMANMQELHMDDTDPVYDTNDTDDSEDPFEKYMTSFRLLQSHLKLLTRNNFAEDCSECVLNFLFEDVFGEEVDIFTNTMFNSVNQLEKKLTTEEFHENESKAAFRVLKERFQHFINYDCEDVSKYFF